SRQPHPGAGWRFMERTVGTRSGCRRLLYAYLVDFESQRLAVGAGPGSPARSDEVSGREVEGGTCGTAADAGWRVGPHLGGSGEPGIAARTEARYCRGVAQGQEGPSQPGAAGGERPCRTGGGGGSSTEGAAARALVWLRGR